MTEERDEDLREAGRFWITVCAGALMLACAGYIVARTVLLLRGDA